MSIHRDPLSRRLYANDASMYEEVPAAVAFPAGEADIAELVTRARETKTPITARAAGTSLAGQATGAGMVMDVSRHMNRILSCDAEQRLACVEPGVIRDSLNRAVAPRDLHFAPDTATTDRCMIGGMIGNNSAGLYSVKYGTTRDHVRRIRAVLSDGTLAEFGPVSVDALAQKRSERNTEGRIYREMLALLEQQADVIRSSYPHPDIIRRNSGYALDRLLQMEPFTPGGRLFNLAEFLCGSEGTLALTVDAEIRLTPLPAHRILVVPHFRSLNAALDAAVHVVAGGAAAVELLDDIVLSAALKNVEQERNRFFLEDAPAAVLLVELHGTDADSLEETARLLSEELRTTHGAYAVPVIGQADEMARVWALRKAGLGLLMGTWSDSKTPEFMEDTAVRVEDLPAYIRDVQDLMARYGARCVYYGHASVGELHLRPELNISTPDGLKTMNRMAEDVADLVRSYRGSLSGEHGDGRVRAPHLDRVFGRELVALWERVKRIWDPEGLLNPGKIVHAELMDAHLRIPFEAKPDQVRTAFHWRDQGGFDKAIGRCNGAGVCRKLSESGGTMCPSFMATQNEKDSTRGRANLFRQLFSGLRADAFAASELKQALDLCLSCKACKTECPANVDMARMKAEFMHGWHHKHGAPRGDRFFAYPERMLARASRFPQVVNRINRWRPARALLQALYGIHPGRPMPFMADESFHEWFVRRPAIDAAGPAVIILNDVFMNYVEPQIGKAMVRVLEAMGCRIDVTRPVPSARARISLGFLEDAKAVIAETVRELAVYTAQGSTVIGQEPSELLTLRDEALDLLDEGDLRAGRHVAERAMMFEEYMNANADACRGLFHASNEVVHVHGHCHAKALSGTAPLMDVVRLAGYRPVDMRTGCCGMAGSFGYGKDHFDVSMAIGELKLFPALRALPDAALICTHGFSCRQQIFDGTGRRAMHPAELVAKTMQRGVS